MQSDLHRQITELLGERSAMVLSGAFVRALVLQRLHTAASTFAGQTIPTAHPLLVAEFEGLSSSGMPLDPSAISAQLGSHVGDRLEVDIGPSFDFSIRLAFKGDPTKTFMRCLYSVPQLKFALHATGTVLRFTMTLADVSETAQVDDAQRQEALKASGMDRDDLLRAEGKFIYGAGQSLLDAVFGKLRDIDLALLFPTVTFGGKLEVLATNTNDETGSAEAVLVVPEFFGLSTLGSCPTHSAVEGAVIVSTPPSGAASGDSRSWDFSTRLETRPSAVPTANAERPIAGLYMPTTLLDAQFSSVTPAVNYDDSDEGFVGYKIHATVAITGVRVTLQQGALRLTLRFKMSARGSLNIDGPCDTRPEIATIEADLPESGEAGISVDLRVALDSGARVLLLSEVVGLNLGKAKVSVSMLGPLGKALGANYWGYVADFIIGRVIQNNLPGMVFDRVRETVDRHYFVVADLRKYLGFMPEMPNSPMYSQGASTVLMGLNYQASAARRS